MLRINLNGQYPDEAMDADTSLLWVPRDGLELTGTGYACEIAVCGSCVVPVNGDPVGRPPGQPLR